MHRNALVGQATNLSFLIRGGGIDTAPSSAGCWFPFCAKPHRTSRWLDLVLWDNPLRRQCLSRNSAAAEVRLLTNDRVSQQFIAGTPSVRAPLSRRLCGQKPLPFPLTPFGQFM